MASDIPPNAPDYDYGLFHSHLVLKPLDVLLLAYRWHDKVKAGNPDVPTRAQLFKKIVESLWGPQSHRHFIWHPWAERMNDAAHEYKYLGVVGCSSSGKSHYAAIYSIVNWLCDPSNTTVFVTSTSLKDSRQRIWGQITEYYQAAPGLPGKLVDSTGRIRTMCEGKVHNISGITLLAGERKKERDAVGKLIGFKNHRIILVGDELPELSPALMTAVLSNLSQGTMPDPQGRPGYFQMIGLGNLFSYYDPCGDFVTPKEGWSSVDHTFEEWETQLGYCLRFDGERSPNVLQGKDTWPIYGLKNLREHQKTLKPDSIAYWRQCRSFPAPIGQDDCIYSEADLIAGECYKTPYWYGIPQKVAALDPAFTTGGDRSVLYIGDFGRATNGLMTLLLKRYEVLTEDVTKRDKPRNIQIAEKFRDICQKEGVLPRNACMDATAAGRLMYDIVCEKWSNEVMPVEFGGAPSELPSTANGNTTCKEAFDRKVSEIWYSGLDFVRSGQLKGICYDLANELKARKYTLRKAGTMKVCVEPKSDMKVRLGYSPDIADAALCLIDLCRNRFGWIPNTNLNAKAGNRLNFVAKARELANINDNLYGESEILDAEIV